MMPAAVVKLKDCNRHGGGNFETSPVCGFGEVSIAPLPDQKRRKASDPAAGMTLAINNLDLSVAANLPSKGRRGGARNRADRESHALTEAQVAKLRAAERHAGQIGLPFTRWITISWKLAGVPLEGMVKATGRFVDLLSRTLARHGSQTAWIWVHENGPSYGWHCHLAIHVPAELVPLVMKLQKRWLRRITGRAYCAGVIESKPIGLRLGLEKGNPPLHVENLNVVMGYACKAAPQSVLDALGIDRHHRHGGLVLGRRCSASQNIGEAARNEKGRP